MAHEIVEKFMAENPLYHFSPFTSYQKTILVYVGDEILAIFSGWKANKSIGPDFQRAYGLFWLWVMGSYEVVRTMSQHKKCFTPECSKNIANLKAKLSVVRMPFAKQELLGSKKKISAYAELSVSGFGADTDTFKFNIGMQIIDAAMLISETKSFLTGITKEVIVDSMYD